MPLEQLITAVVVTVWILAAVVVLRRRRPRREDRSIEAHQRALRALGAMRSRPITGLADLPPDDEPEEAQVWLIEDDHLPPPLPVVTPLLRDGQPVEARPAVVRPPVAPPAVARPAVARPLVARPPVVRPAVAPPPPAPAPALPTFGDGFGAYDTEFVPETPREPRQRRTLRLGRRPAWGIAAAVGVLALVVAGSALLGSGGRARPRPVPAAAAAPAHVEPTAPPSTTVAAYPVTLGATGVQVQVPSGTVITFTAVGRCWLEAADGTGTVSFQGILQPGATESLRVADVLSARVGNAQAVQLTVDARPAPLPAVGPNPLDIALTTHPAA
jgi:hypothetical protein